MFSEFELKVILGIAGGAVAVNSAAMLLFILFAKVPNGKLREAIRSCIYELDKFADDMENEEKKRRAIQQVSEFMSWRRFFIPNVLIGCLIDSEVTAIRKMQAITQTPDLHEKEEEPNAGLGTGWRNSERNY